MPIRSGKGVRRPEPKAKTAKRGPTRGRTIRTAIVCIVILAVLGVIPVFVNTFIGYAPIVCAVVLLVLNFVYLMIVKRSLSFAEVGPDDGCTRGDVLNFALTVKNRSFLPVLRLEVLFFVSDMFGSEGGTSVRKLTLPPRSEKTFDLGVRFDHIGHYEIGIRQVWMFDPLGVFYSMRQNDQMHEVDIEPRVYDIGPLELSDDAMRESTKNVKTYMSDGMDYSSVREYRWGDPIKSIHWKLSSKLTNTYLTRLYEMPTTPGVAVFCDFESPETDALALMNVNDAVIETAFSAIRYATANGYDAELLFLDDMGKARRFTGSLNAYRSKALSVMPLMQTGSGAAMRELLRKESSSIYCQHNVVVCTSNADEAMANSLLSTRASHHNPLLFAVDVSHTDDSAARGDDVSQSRKTARRLASAGIWCRRLASAAELEGGA